MESDTEALTTESMDNDFKEKLRSINIGLPSRRAVPKKTVDVTDDTVNTVTEHYDGRQDVQIDLAHPINAQTKINE